MHPETLRSWFKQWQIDTGDAPGRRPMINAGSPSLRPRSESLSDRTRSCEARRLSSRRNSTAHRNDVCASSTSTRPTTGSSRSAASCRSPCRPTTQRRPVRRRQRQLDDERLPPEVARVFESNYRVYGRRKIWAQLNREGIAIGRDRCERLMKQAGICGRGAGPQASNHHGPMRRHRERQIWSIGTGRSRHRIGCGSPTSPTSEPGRRWSTSRS